MRGAGLTPQEVRRVQLDVLGAFDDFCQEHALTYALTYGSLLGAVRHQGFIPWDDDVDVMMPRTDFDHLRRHARIGAFRVGGALDDSRRWPVPYVKVFDPTTVVTGEGRFEPEVGVNIDVFPLDGFPEGRRPRLRRRWTAGATRLLTWQAIVDRPERSLLRQCAVATARPALERLPRQALLASVDRGAEPVLGDCAGILVGSYQWSVPTTALLPVAQLPFEGDLRNVPAEPDTVLRRMYGEHYLSPPPLHARRSHHVFTAYWQ